MAKKTAAAPAAKRTPKAFPVGMKVNVHSVDDKNRRVLTPGVVVGVPNFDERVVRLEKNGVTASHAIGVLSERAE